MHKILWVACLFLSLPAAAAEVRSFTASGVGTAVARPDLVFAKIGFDSTGATPEEATLKDAAIAQRLVSTLQAQGIAGSDLQTATYVIEADMGPEGCGREYSDVPYVPCVIEGYIVRNAMTLRIRDLTSYSRVLGSVIDAGIKDISAITLDVADRERYRDEAYSNALLAAKAKAELTAKTLGFKLGAILDIGANIQIQYSDESERPATLASGLGASEDEGAADLIVGPIQAGELTFSRAASITFEIVD